MTWLWTDELARLLIDRDGVSPERLARWVSRPVALRARDGEPLQQARRLLDEDDEEHQTAAA